ncbi:unnamed protein product [Toxocara canis]|uniref:B30.2/SPRY domain-containing protein n=1 Tax=Toxocara canis TaxID=6265 RepID=A0A183UIC1_TOXCA|nr:unnamed protein product [Toxocara canis]
MAPDPDYEAEEEDKPLPEFHGEPVPDSDDDVIIEDNADLHIKASETDPMVIDPDNGDGFALMWGGVRSTYGICVPDNLNQFPVIVFQAKVLEFLSIKHIPFEEADAYDIRLVICVFPLQLGESAHSYAFSMTARKALGNVFTDYGEPFQVGDVITTAVDLARGEISYWLNKQWMGVAFSEVHLMAGEVLFPHICTKNCKVAVNLGDGKVEDWLSLEDLNYEGREELKSQQRMTFMANIEKDRLVRGPTPPASKSECTVLMMVGLPGVGKTTWVRQYLKDHPHEQWTLLSADTVLAAMKVNGVARSRGRWDMVMGLTAKALTRSLHLACRRRRNYIIDQTNVSKDSRRKKLSQFKDFQRKCVVIIPSEEEMLNRQMRQSRTDGVKQTPVEAMLELKGWNFYRKGAATGLHFQSVRLVVHCGKREGGEVNAVKTPQAVRVICCDECDIAATFSIPNVELEPVEDVYFVEPPLERIGDAIELVARLVAHLSHRHPFRSTENSRRCYCGVVHFLIDSAMSRLINCGRIHVTLYFILPLLMLEFKYCRAHYSPSTANLSFLSQYVRLVCSRIHRKFLLLFLLCFAVHVYTVGPAIIS